MATTAEPAGPGGEARALARRSAEAVLAEDECSRGLGMELVDVGPGRATLRMRVRPDMANGHGIAHGGLLFTLADTSLAVASSSGGEATVAASATIDFLRPVSVGTVLVATAESRHQGGRTGVYDATVTDGDGRVVALFRGRAARIGPLGPVPRP
jgi:acyl-CoA thioesterase